MMFTQTIHTVKQSLTLKSNLIANVMMFVYVFMCVSVGCLLPDFQYVKIFNWWTERSSECSLFSSVQKEI